jgi:hypothetical protein
MTRRHATGCLHLRNRKKAEAWNAVQCIHCGTTPHAQRGHISARQLLEANAAHMFSSEQRIEFVKCCDHFSYHTCAASPVAVQMWQR